MLVGGCHTGTHWVSELGLLGSSEGVMPMLDKVHTTVDWLPRLTTYETPQEVVGAIIAADHGAEALLLSTNTFLGLTAAGNSAHACGLCAFFRFFVYCFPF